MLTIRNNIFETNSSSTHSFVFDLSTTFEDKQTVIKQLNIVNGKLIIDGCKICKPNAYIVNVNDKFSLIATEIVANNNKQLKKCFEETVKDYLPEITEFKYNVIFAGTKRNANYFPLWLNSRQDYESSNSLKEGKLIEVLLKDQQYMKQFLFGNKSYIEGVISFG